MLLEFKCRNHRSIKGEILFSLLATTDSSHEENLILINDSKLIRCAEVYGANGSGKTSLLNALSTMTAIVLNSFNHQPGDLIIRFPHKLSDSMEPTTFSIIFIKDGIKYSYGFSYREDCITDEYLFYWPNGKQSKIFERNEKDYSFSAKFQTSAENCKNYFKPNRLLLSCSANATSIKEIEQIFLFFKRDLIIYPGEPNNWLDYSAEQLQKNPDLKKEFLAIMCSFGSDIIDISSEVEQRAMTEKDLPPILHPIIPKNLFAQKMNFIKLKLNYKQFTLDFNEESAGVQKLFKFLCPIIDIIQNGKVFICDEIESHLHPSIVLEIVRRFCENTKSDAQVIFTTHDTDLLDLDLVRRDQIWFTELNPEFRSTDLYSLAELKNVRKDENIRKGYIAGKYGAIPMMNKDIQQCFGE